MELLIGLDNRQWLPAHVEDSWNPDDDMRLMRSVFGYRYMITDGWGRDLFSPDNSQDGPVGMQGGSVEATEGAQEVRLEEYRGWSQGTWSRENGGVQDTTSPRDGCRGTLPRSRGGDRCSRGPHRPARSKSKRRAEGIRRSIPESIGASGPIRDAVLPGQMGSAAEAQERDTTSQEKDTRQSLARA